MRYLQAKTVGISFLKSYHPLIFDKCILIIILVFFSSFSSAVNPGWTPVAGLQYNMQLVGKLQLEGGGYATNSNDVVAAFIG